ncbi:hypothetical protein Btru_044858 [Bulinus truncatus]|nr:hypothetical protein Btru_044858 [Bulinus truncatus]
MKCFLLLAAIAVFIMSQHLALSQLMPVQEESTTTPPPPKNTTYWITMSSSIRPGQALELKVEILTGNDPVTVNISIRTYDGGKTLVSGSPAVVKPGGVQSIYVNIPENIKALSGEQYLYSLQTLVTGEGKTVQFKHEVMLTFREKFISVFVQTDKAMYKAGQLVKFRILSMTPDLKVIRNNSNDVVIKDSKGNKIQQWLNVSDPNQRGVVELRLRLATNIPTGDWSIIVKTKGTETTKTFTVDDYVLPKYEVKLNAPPFSLTSDPILKATVKAMYTYGQPVSKATADVVIQYSYYYSPGTQPQIKITGPLNKDGEFTFQVSQSQLLELATKSVTWSITDLNYQSFKVSANVTETDTGRVQSGTTVIMYYSSPLKMNFLDISPSNYKPGLNYTGYLEVKKKDDTLFTDAEARKISLQFNVTYTVKLSQEELEKLQNQSFIDNAGSDSSFDGVNKLGIRRPMWPYQQTKTLILSLDEPIRTLTGNGLIQISFKVPMEAESATIEVRCLEPFAEEMTSKYINKMNSPSNSYLQLRVPTERPKVGSTIIIKAEATVKIEKLYYQAYSKGKLLISNTVVSAENSQTVEFSITVTQDMTTKLNIIAYFIADKTEFVVDGLSLSVDGTFPKPVSVEFSQSKVKPGEQVNVIVKAEKDSMVYLLSNDKSVQLLKSGNDITQEVVQDELIQYDYGGYSMWRYMFFCGWPSYFGGDNAKSIFQNAGIEVLTDGLTDWRSNDVVITGIKAILLALKLWYLTNEDEALRTNVCLSLKV